MKDSSPYLATALTRRGFLSGSAALLATTAAGVWLPLGAEAAEGGIREMRGEVLVNGKRADRGTVIRLGDTVATGQGSFLMFTVGQDAFMLRERGELRLEPNPQESRLVTGLRLISGALGAVFGKRQTGKVNIVAATVTAGIRGTGVYMEAHPEGTYFCSCYGTVDLQANANPSDRESIVATHHNNPRMILKQPKDGELFLPSTFQTHTDEEMDRLEQAVGRRAPWAQAR
ncbi:MAG: hypothetical protein JSS40_09655 [Proteobacteria bacterium]|nr:hypothetical protein [Pseudomonadota bacterium]